jgi:hypothetical protein
MPAAAQAVNADTVSKKFELSFGQSILFISYDKSLKLLNQEAIVIPTNSILFLAELRPLKLLRIPVFFNLPTESKQFLINNQLVNERASPTFGTGLQLRAFRIKVNDKTTIDFEAGPLGSILMTEEHKLRFAPIGAGRFRIVKDHSFSMYMGTSYSIGINAWGLIYGTGYIF